MKAPKQANQTTEGARRGPFIQRQCSHCAEEHEEETPFISSSRIGRVQTKLAVGAPNDIYEQEADRIADQVMAMPAHDTIRRSPVHVQRVTESSSGQTTEAPASVEHVLSSPGQPLEPGLREEMEGRFGHDFSEVRVHTGAEAEQSATDVGAEAYTGGSHIVWGPNRSGLHEPRKLSILTHELAHVIQQQRREPDYVQRQEVLEDESVVTSSPVVVSPCMFISENGRFMVRVQSDIFAAEYYGYSDAQLDALSQTRTRPDIDDPSLPAERFIRTLEAWTGLQLSTVAREELNARGRIPLENYGTFHYAIFIEESDLVRWFGVEQWRDYLSRDLDTGLGVTEREQPTTETVLPTTTPQGMAAPINDDPRAMEHNRELGILYLILMQHFTSLSLTPELTAMTHDGIDIEELQTIVGDDELRHHLTMLFTQGWSEFQRVGGTNVDIYGPLIERVLEQYSRRNVNALGNLLRIGHGNPERDVLGIVHRYSNVLLYDHLGAPLRNDTAWRDWGFVGFSVSETETRAAIQSGTTLTREEAGDLIVANLFAQALGVHGNVMIVQGVSAYIRHIDEVTRRVERGLIPELMNTIDRTIKTVIKFMAGHALARLMMTDPITAPLGVALELALRGYGYWCGIEFLSDTWEVLEESAFHLSRVREDEEGRPTALSEMYLDQAAEPVRDLINRTAEAMTFGAFALAIRGVRAGRQARWGRQRGRRGDWRYRSVILRMVLNVTIATHRGTTELSRGYGSTSTTVVEAPTSRSVAPMEAIAEPQRVSPETSGSRATTTTEAPQSRPLAPAETIAEPTQVIAEPASGEAVPDTAIASSPALQALEVESPASEAQASATVLGVGESDFGDQLVRIYLADPNSFSERVLSPQHQIAMLQAFLRSPDVYLAVSRTPRGDDLLSYLSQASLEQSAPTHEAPAQLLDTAPEAETPIPEASTEEATPSPAAPSALDPSTTVSVNLSSGIYHPPGTRYFGSSGAHWEDMTLAEAQARDFQQTAARVRITPPSGVYHVSRPTPDTIEQRAWLGARQARAGFERAMMSASEYASAIIQGMQRLHPIGAGLGAEAREAIRLGPEFVNQILQRSGVEQFLRDLRDQVLAQGGQIHLRTRVQTHWGTLRLMSIEYRIQTVGENGQLQTLADAIIEVDTYGNSRGAARRGLDVYTETPWYDRSGRQVRGRAAAETESADIGN